MKYSIGLFYVLLFAFPLQLLSQQTYRYTVDIANIKNDQVAVQMKTPAINSDTVVLSFPKAIPGSYAVKDFGRFIKDLKAFNKAGKKLPVEKLNNNQYQIANATNLSSINYFVSDTWDTHYPNFVFQPGGTNIDAGRNVVMNNHAFFGYFENYEHLPIELEIKKPVDFYAATHLQVEHEKNNTDIIRAKNYNYLADNPIVYSVPDTTSFQSGKTTVNVSVYSATGKVNSKQIAEYLEPLAGALSSFFNGLPVSSYQFLFYFEDPSVALANEGEGGYGALEHNYSSLYFLPEMRMESRLRSLVNEVAGHEFLHILTPLNLHSKEIEEFDFIDPKMSKHLWLYEGVTEYFAHLVQLQAGLISRAEFFRNMKQKMEQAKEYGTFSMTEMSKNVLTEAYKSKYNSVYNKGALLAFMLDLYIRDKTQNTRDLKGVIQTLATKYGPNKPFNDENLFDDLIKASHPDVQQFIDDYIVGSKPLPYQQMLATIGYRFDEQVQMTTYNIGQKLSLAYDEPTGNFVFNGVGPNALALKNGDVLLSIQDTPVNADNLNELWDKYIQQNTVLPELTMIVLRNGVEKRLEGKLFKGRADISNLMLPLPEPTEKQQANLNLLVRGRNTM